MILNKEEVKLAIDFANYYYYNMISVAEIEEYKEQLERGSQHVALFFLNLLNQKDILKESQFINNIDEFSNKIDLLTKHLRHRLTKPKKLIDIFDELYNNDFYLNDKTRIKELKKEFEESDYNPKNIEQNLNIITKLWICSIISEKNTIILMNFNNTFKNLRNQISSKEFQKVYYLFNSASFETNTFFKQNENLIKIDELPKELTNKEISSVKYTFLFIVGRHLTKIDRNDTKILSVENMENLLYLLKKGNCPNFNLISQELNKRIEEKNIYFDINKDFDKIQIIINGIGFLIKPMEKRTITEQNEYLDKEFSNYENLVEKHKEKDFSFDR